MTGFSEFFQKEIWTRPYFPEFKGLSNESRSYKIIFGLLAFPLAIPFLSIANLSFWVFTPSRVDFPVFLKTIIFQIIVEVCLILYVILLARDRKYAPFFTKTHALLVVLAVTLFISGLFSLDPNASFFSNGSRADGLIFLFHVGIYFFLLTWLIRDKIRLELLFKIAIVCGALASFFIIFMYAAQAEKGLGLACGEIIKIILGNTSFFAHYLLMLILINIYFLLIKPRVWNLIAAILFAVFALMTLSSTAVFLAFCLYGVFLWFARRKWFYWCALAGLGILFFGLVLGNSLIIQILSPASEPFVRGQVWKDAIGLVFKHNLFLGYGWGNNEIMWNALARDSWAASGDLWYPIFFDKVHNIFIEFLTAGGVIGLIIFVVFWVRVLWLCFMGFASNSKQSALPKSEFELIQLFFFIAFFVNLLYLTFNFDALMSYVLISIVLAGFVLFQKEPRYELLISKRAGIVIAGVFIIVGSGVLYQYNLKPFNTYRSIYNAQVEIKKLSGAPFLRKQKIFTALDQARTANQPYNLLLLDTAKSLYELPDNLTLDLEERGRVYQQLQSIYEIINKKHPSNPYYYYQRSAMEKKFAFNLPAVEQYLKKALELAPHKGTLRFYLAVDYFQQDKTEEAVEIFKQLSAEGLYPGTVDVFLALIDIKQGRLKQGQKEFVSALSFYKPTALEWNLFTKFYLEHGDKQSLIDWYNRILGIVGEDSYLNTVIASLK